MKWFNGSSLAGLALASVAWLGAACGHDLGTTMPGGLGLASFQRCDAYTHLDCRALDTVSVGTTFAVEVTLSKDLPWDVSFSRVVSASPAILEGSAGRLAALAPGDVALLAVTPDGEMIDYVRVRVTAAPSGISSTDSGHGDASTTGEHASTTESDSGRADSSSGLETDAGTFDTETDTDDGPDTDTNTDSDTGSGATESASSLTDSDSDAMTSTGLEASESTGAP